MQFYRVIDVETDPVNVVEYTGTLAEAHTRCKMFNPFRYSNLRIELVDISTDKHTITLMLNRVDVKTSEPMRTWRLAARGGLTDCPNGE
jgi:hypothetical protein